MRFLLLLALIGGLLYLFQHSPRKSKSKEIPPPPPAMEFLPIPAITESELIKVREATKDADASVRWAAIELLYRIRDPKAVEILENMLALDTEPSVRKNALNMLRQSHHPMAVNDLLIALKDQEKDIRVAALLALGEIGDTSSVPQITLMLRDPDADVRMQALHALGRLQEIKHTEYQNLTDNLRTQYETAVRKAQADGARAKTGSEKSDLLGVKKY